MPRDEEFEPYPQYVESVLDLFRRKLDTVTIAEMLKRPEHAVERWLHVALDQLYKARI